MYSMYFCDIKKASFIPCLYRAQAGKHMYMCIQIYMYICSFVHAMAHLYVIIKGVKQPLKMVKGCKIDTGLGKKGF